MDSNKRSRRSERKQKKIVEEPIDDGDDYYHSDQEYIEKIDSREVDSILEDLSEEIKQKGIDFSARDIIKNPLRNISDNHDHLVILINKKARHIASSRLSNESLSLIAKELKQELTKDVFFNTFITSLSDLESDFHQNTYDTLLKTIANFEDNNHTKCKEIVFDFKNDQIYCLFILDNKGVFFLLIALDCARIVDGVKEDECYTLNSSALHENIWKKIYELQVRYKGHCFINCPCFK